MLSAGDVTKIPVVSNQDIEAYEPAVEEQSVTADPQSEEAAPTYDEYQTVISGQSQVTQTSNDPIEIIPPSESDPHTLTVRFNSVPQEIERMTEEESLEDKMLEIANMSSWECFFTPVPPFLGSIMNAFGTVLQARFELSFDDNGYVSEIKITDLRNYNADNSIIQDRRIAITYVKFAKNIFENIRAHEWQDNIDYNYYLIVRLYDDEYASTFYPCK